MIRKSICLLLAELILYTIPLAAQTETPENNFDLFESNEILEISLSFDIAKFVREKSKDEYLDAILTINISKEDSIIRKIRVKSCGNMRNKYCKFPPVVLNFKKTEFVNENLYKLGKVKFYTHCRNGNEEYLFKEYLVYRLYNVLTDYSFRVRMARITYNDIYNKKKPVVSYGFFMEPTHSLEERLSAIRVGEVPLTQNNIMPEMIDRMAIFSYMIGNTDWSVSNQHNCKIFIQKDLNRPDKDIIIPFDFDYAGIVNTDYAIPGDGLNIESVCERIYIGICRNEEEFLIALKEFSDKKEELYSIIQEFDPISYRGKKDMIRYLDEFYKLFNDRNAIVKVFLNECKHL
jgi:hypothetical protein